MELEYITEMLDVMSPSHIDLIQSILD